MGRFICTLAAMVIVTAGAIAGFGYYRGWFEVERQDRGSNTEVTFKVDKDKIKDDTNKAIESGQDLVNKTKQKAQDLINGETVTGVITGMENNTLSVTDEKQKVHVLQWSDNSTVRRGEETIMRDQLRSGQQVTVTYRENEGQNVISSVTIPKK